jgi:antitoxin (DNA-binding transcriptional repressor) of toxin-antitoxin stability system
MTKDVTIADLKEHLEEHLEEVRQGTTLRLVEAGGVIAQLSPPPTRSKTPPEMVYRAAQGSFADLKLPPAGETEIDVAALALAFLREDRDAR